MTGSHFDDWMARASKDSQADGHVDSQQQADIWICPKHPAHKWTGGYPCGFCALDAVRKMREAAEPEQIPAELTGVHVSWQNEEIVEIVSPPQEVHLFRVDEGEFLLKVGLAIVKLKSKKPIKAKLVEPKQ